MRFGVVRVGEVLVEKVGLDGEGASWCEIMHWRVLDWLKNTGGRLLCAQDIFLGMINCKGF